MKFKEKIGCLLIAILILLAFNLLFRLIRQFVQPFLAGVIVVGIIILAFLFYSYIMHKRRERKLLKLNRSRVPLGKEEFIKFFVLKGYNKIHIEIIYDKLKNLISIDNFSMYPDDNIEELYGINSESFDDFVEEIFMELKRNIPSQKEIDLINKDKINFEYILKLLSISTSNE